MFRRRRTFPHCPAVIAGFEDRVLLAAVQVNSTPGPRGTVNLTLTGTPDDDLVILRRDANNHVHVSGSQFSWNGRADVSELVFPLVNDLVFNLGAGNDSGIFDAPKGNVTIHDGAEGDAYSNYRMETGPSAAPQRMGSLKATFDHGTAYLVMETIGSSLTIRDININLVSTDSSSVYLGALGTTQLNVTGALKINSPEAVESRDSVSIFAVPAPSGTSSSKAQPRAKVNLGGGTEINLGGGNDYVNMSGAVSSRRRTVLNLGEGDDEVAILHTGAVPNLSDALLIQGPLIVNLGNGMNRMTLSAAEGVNRTRVQGPVTITSGRQADVVQISGTDIRGDLTINMGFSDPIEGLQSPDFVALTASDVAGKTQITAGGPAEVFLGWNPFGSPRSSELRFEKEVNVAIGSGEPRVGSPDGPDVIFNSAQNFTGLASQIIVIYQGNVVADPTQRHLMNAILLFR